MIARQDSIVFTFATTTAALLFEKEAQEAGLSGRLIPVPRSISASCGLSYMIRKKEAAGLDAFLSKQAADFSGRYEMEL